MRAFTLFATHYFELTALASEIEACVNVHLDATEHGEGIVFLHAVKDGPANRSYGLQVAQLAGVPRDVIARAREYLAALEAERDRRPTAGSQGELPLFAGETVSGGPKPELAANPLERSAAALRAAVEALDPDELTPKAALEALYRLRALIEPD